jgi:hypothetical protein
VFNSELTATDERPARSSYLSLFALEVVAFMEDKVM